RQRDQGRGPARGRQAGPIREGRRHDLREEGPDEASVLSARRAMAAMERAPFDVLEGEFVAIVGPSGCGKSTVLNMIGGLVRPSAGAGLICGAPGRHAAPPPVGYAFPKDNPFPSRPAP